MSIWYELSVTHGYEERTAEDLDGGGWLWWSLRGPGCGWVAQGWKKIHFSLVSLQHRLRLVSVSRGAQCEVLHFLLGENQGLPEHPSVVCLTRIFLTRGYFIVFKMYYYSENYFLRRILDDKLDPIYPRRTSIAVSANTVKFMNPTKSRKSKLQYILPWRDSVV